MFFILFID